jgi:flagellin
MALRINSNVDAMAAHRHLAQTSDKISQAMERLSSGYRINEAADDAAGKRAIQSEADQLSAEIDRSSSRRSRSPASTRRT